ncbi:hypothetical protein [Streptomyces avicenniae]|uniref:hypothetical protein n=1 Tax=Streptomyces avicenniae TaxID=500153 RepID=UPI00069C8790|nr:hypothetical protein [Streptomyces avicenniae]
MPDASSSGAPLAAGRGPAGRALVGWATDPGAERLCLVSGSRGIGKSHLLAWFVAHGADRPATRVHAVLPAAGRTPGPLVWELAHQLGHRARSVADLLARVARDARPSLIAVPDLHQAVARERRTGTRLVADVLEPLLHLPWVRVVAEVRDAAASGFDAQAAVIDLDDPRMTDPDAYAAWYDGLAPGPVPAAAAYPFPALGHLAARIPGAAGLGGAAAEGEEAVRRLCGAWWDGLDAAVRRALGTLARTRGPLDLATWRALHAAAFPGEPGAADAVTEAARALGGRSFRLPVPFLAELAAPAAPEGLFDALLSLVPVDSRGVPDWAGAPGYVLEHVAGHAGTGEEAARLLSDPGFLVHGAPGDISGLLDRRGVPTPGALRSVWGVAAPALDEAGTGLAERAAVLHAAALPRAPRLAELLAPAAGRHAVVARWSLVRASAGVGDGPAKGERWPGAVRALALGPAGHGGPDEEPWVLAADPLGQLRRLDVGSGVTTGRVGGAPAGPVRGLAPLPGGSWAALDPSGAVRRVPDDGGPPLVPHGALDPGRAALTCLAGDAEAGLLAVGDASGTVSVRAPDGSGTVRLTAGLTDAPLTAVCCLALGNGRALVIAAAEDGRVVLWGPPGPPSDVPVARRDAVPRALAATRAAGGVVCVTAWADGLVELRSLPAGGRLSFRAHHDVAAVALSPGGMLVGAGDEAVTGWQCDLSRLEVPEGGEG